MNRDGQMEEKNEWARRWHKQIRPDRESLREDVARRPPPIPARKSFPSWLSSQTLPEGQKRSGARWFTYWFPGRGVVTRREAELLNLLRKESQSEEELEALSQIIRRVEGRRGRLQSGNMAVVQSQHREQDQRGGSSRGSNR